MKVVILLGRGIEGCGVTKYTLEQHDWLVKNGHRCTIIANDDKKWTRKKSHDTTDITLVKLTNDVDIAITIAACNRADVVIINSLPSSGHAEESIDGFKKVIECIDKPIVLIQHDHSIHSIRRNEAMDEAILKAKMIFAHSPTNDFAAYAKKVVAENSDEFGASVKIYNFQPGLDFEVVRQKYWKPIGEQDAMHHKWVGRLTPWKGYGLMTTFHNNHLKDWNCLTTLEGLEKSIAFVSFRNDYVFNDRVGGAKDDIAKFDLSKAYGENAYAFGPFKNDEMLERISRVGFGYQLSKLNPKFIHRSIEYTHCELACCGVIPVFHKEFGDACTHRVIGDKLSACRDNGTLWLGDDNQEDVFEQVKKLTKDSGMRDEWREMAYEFYKSHQDAEPTFSEMFKLIEKTI